MGNLIVIVILAVIVAFALRNTVKHLKGQGDCCGGGGEKIPVFEEEKKLQGPVIGTRTLHIEGMHCDRCKARVERAINHIEGASARVDLKKGIALVSLDREVPQEQLVNAVTLQDYKVTSVE